MGLFFEKRESSKPFIWLRHFIMLMVLVVIGAAILNGFSSIYLTILWIIFGCSSILDGIEAYLKKTAKKRYLMDFGIAGLFYLLAVI
ncbi:hypothetical protein [Bacillus sp. FJAT-27245]|uniref:hypothetical protein n=1 Tax=Bacillus sp. FJAT-27245 TaxID=1684144 RepID=UPI0006A782D1|nr:hypothetical protein [Bacillus sp. FJAT-27245]